MVQLKNGSKVLLSHVHVNYGLEADVVLAVNPGWEKLVCWVVDKEGNAFWGHYGIEDAIAAYNDRTGLSITERGLLKLLLENYGE